MRRGARFPLFFALVLSAAFMSSRPAWAPGSISLEDVLKAVKTHAKLVAEINAELKTNGLAADRVICDGARFGRQWTNLGGGRAAPYTCVIGKRELTIEADLTFYDAKGRSLGSDMNETTFAKAETFRETHVTWKWQNAKPGD
jgi:hypothetical protein